MTEKSPAGSRQNLWNWVAMLCALVASGIHLYLVNHHYSLFFGASEASSICNINRTFNCDAVNLSIYSSFLGVPIAMWGLFTNLALLLLLFWNSVSGYGSYGRRMAFYAATFVALMSLLMGFFSTFVIGSLCLFCTGTYVLSFILWYAVYKTVEPKAFRNLGRDIAHMFKTGDQGHFGYLVFLILIPVASFVINSMVVSSYVKDLDIVVTENIQRWKANPAVSFDLKSGLFWGPSDARMTVVEFADFNCPHCKHAAPTLEAFAHSRKDVRFIFQNFPLDGSCNSVIPEPGVSCILAKATYCAEKLGQKGWEAHHYLFENQGSVDSMGVAKFLKLDEAQFKTCLDSNETHEAIVQQAKQGQAAGVHGTPSVYVNGRLLPGAQLLPILERAYSSL